MKITVTRDLVILVTEGGKGEWTLSRLLACGVELIGFGGEDHLYILLQSWQSGDYHVTVCHCQVDSRTDVRQAMVESVGLTSCINALIEQTGIDL